MHILEEPSHRYIIAWNLIILKPCTIRCTILTLGNDRKRYKECKNHARMCTWVRVCMYNRLQNFHTTLAIHIPIEQGREQRIYYHQSVFLVVLAHSAIIPRAPGMHVISIQCEAHYAIQGAGAAGSSSHRRFDEIPAVEGHKGTSHELARRRRHVQRESGNIRRNTSATCTARKNENVQQ